MRAVTIRQPYLADIMDGNKTLEIRKRRLNHQGPLVLHSAATPVPPYRKDPADPSRTLPCEDNGGEVLLLGQVLCVVDMVGCRRMRKTDCEAACVEGDFDIRGQYVWEFTNVRLVKPLPKRGNCAVWMVPDEELEYL